MDSMTRGWVKWADSRIIDQRVQRRHRQRPYPHRYSLGDLDEATWEQNPDGTVRDPWQPDYRVVLIGLDPPHSELTFVGSSIGARIAFQDLCKAYTLGRTNHEGCMPVVSLEVGKRTSPRYGVIKQPAFSVQGWATVEDVKAGRKSKVAKPAPDYPELPGSLDRRAGKGKAKQTDLEEVLNDAIPDWGQKAGAK
jgi:hypothetical protein